MPRHPSIDEVMRYRTSFTRRASNETYAAMALVAATVVALVWANIGDSKYPPAKPVALPIAGPLKGATPAIEDQDLARPPTTKHPVAPRKARCTASIHGGSAPAATEGARNDRGIGQTMVSRPAQPGAYLV